MTCAFTLATSTPHQPRADTHHQPTAPQLENHVNCLSCEQETDGEYLCQHCTSRVNRQLTELLHMHDALSAYLRPSSQVSNKVGSGSPSPDAPLPVREDALNLIGPGGIVTVLETWRQALHEDAGLRWPTAFGDSSGRLRRAVYGLQAQLEYVRLDWPQAGDFAREIRDLHAAAKSIVAPEERPMRAGTCTTVVGDGEACGAVLRVRTGDPEIRCSWCGATYPPESWLELAATRDAA